MKFLSNNYFDLAARILFRFIESDEYAKAVDILFDCYKRKGTVFTMGCGGSASTATHFAADLAKTTGGMKAMSLVDNIPLVSAWTNDNGWESVFESQLDKWITKHDVLVGFSVHGGNKKWSSNLIKAMELAKKRGAKIIGFSGFGGGEMEKMADASLVIPISDEVYGTPLVEGLHVVLNHGIIFALKEKMK